MTILPLGEISFTSKEAFCMTVDKFSEFLELKCLSIYYSDGGMFYYDSKNTDYTAEQVFDMFCEYLER